jgi:hypothetical protein
MVFWWVGLNVLWVVVSVLCVINCNNLPVALWDVYLLV